MANEENLRPDFSLQYLWHLIITCFDNKPFGLIISAFVAVFGTFVTCVYLKFITFIENTFGISFSSIIFIVCIGLILFVMLLTASAFFVGIFAENNKLKKKIQIKDDDKAKDDARIKILTDQAVEYEEKLKNASQKLDFYDIAYQYTSSMHRKCIRLKCKYPPRMHALLAIEYKNHNETFFQLLSIGRVSSIDKENVLIVPLGIIPVKLRFSKGNEFRINISITEEELQKDIEEQTRL